jgi:hypothetical protein
MNVNVKCTNPNLAYRKTPGNAIKAKNWKFYSRPIEISTDWDKFRHLANMTKTLSN